MKTIGKGLLQFNYDEVAGKGGFISPASGLQITEDSDFFRLFLDDQDFREIPVYSSQQTPTSYKLENGKWELIYEGLKAANGKRYKVLLKLYITEQDDTLLFDASLTNSDTSICINEIQYPFIQADSLGGAREKDVLYYPYGFGWRIPNPWEELQHYHSEYRYKDEVGTWFGYPYPSNGATMAWYGVQSDKYFYYVGQHDPNVRICVPSIGLNPRDSKKPFLRLTISSFPVLRPGETEQLSPKVAAIWKGDWKTAANYYRAFAETTFYQPQLPPEWVTKFTGWQRVIMKHQYGEILYKYEDLPKLYKEGISAGIDTLLVFGWWKGRFDNSYPHYEPDEKMGGAEELKKAIAQIQEAGGRVILYTNGCLIDLQSEFYKNGGDACTMRDVDGNEYIEHYRFGGQGMMIRSFGYKSFALGCMSTEQWQERLILQGNIMKQFNPDSIFYDQIGSHPCKPCFQSSHPHGNRVDRDWAYRIQIFEKLKGLCSGDMAFGTENLSDIGCSLADYTHNSTNVKPDHPHIFPYLFRYTFPEIISTNRNIQEEYEGYEDDLIYAFLFGLRFCVSIYRCRGHLGMMPNYKNFLRRLINLRNKYEDYMVFGKFTSTVETHKLPDHLVCTEYVHKDGNGLLQVIWNRSNKDIIFNGLRIPAKDIVFNKLE
ncbi:MAG: hypothetical protein GX094_09040 [Clostridiales bacterium]|nr:hypothetical protein [Clostridiales bacterium]